MSKINSPLSISRTALLISLYFPPEPGGGAMTALNRALILKKIGYSVFVLCGFPTYPSGTVNHEKYKRKFFFVEKIDDLTVIRLRLLPLASNGYLRRFILFINFSFLTLLWTPRVLKISSDTKLVYALAPIMFSSLIGFYYSKITRAFFIYEVSAFWPEELVAIKSDIEYTLILFGKVFAKISYGLPDMLIVISKLAAKYLVDNYHPKVPVYTMPIGADPTRYPTRTKESSRKKLINEGIIPSDLEDKFIVLYSGVITKITKVRNIIYAAEKLSKHSSEIAFLIIGEGEEKQNIKKYVSDNMIKNLYLLPFQDAEWVPYIISAADVCVVPLSSEPIYATTVPTKFFDYLACKKPQIGICAGELEELIRTNNIGLTVKDGETDKLVAALKYLSSSTSIIDSMTLNSSRLLSNFTLDALSSNLNEMLKEQMLIKNDRIDK